MDNAKQIERLKRDLADYKRSLSESTDQYVKAANMMLACQEMIKETEEAIYWLEAGGISAPGTDQ